MAVSEELLNLLVCPKCKGKLDKNASGASLDCPACKLSFPIENDIPVMLESEAKPLD